MGNDRGLYIASNYSSLISPPGAEIYQTARLAPSSLKYYGLCLRQGSYRVRLHFAEIMFFDNSTFPSLGKRIFDVAIQVSGEPVIFEPLSNSLVKLLVSYIYIFCQVTSYVFRIIFVGGGGFAGL